MTNMTNMTKVSIKSRDYYKIFTIDSGEMQLTDLENRLCNCVQVTNYQDNTFIRLYSCWERALEYIYRAYIKNYGSNLIHDLTKAKSECETLCKLLEKRKLQNHSLFCLIPEDMRKELNNSIFIEEYWRRLHKKFGYKKYPLLYPMTLSYIIDFDKKFNYIDNIYSFRLSSILERDAKNIFKVFTFCNDYNDFQIFIELIDEILKKYSNWKITFDFRRSADPIDIVSEEFHKLFGDLFEMKVEKEMEDIFIDIRRKGEEKAFCGYHINTCRSKNTERTVNFNFSPEAGSKFYTQITPHDDKINKKIK